MAMEMLCDLLEVMVTRVYTQVELHQFVHLRCGGDFPGGAVVKNLPANAEDTGSSLDQATRSHMPWSN